MSPRPRNAARPAPRAHSIGSKATTPSHTSRTQASRNGGAASAAHKAGTQDVDWDAVIKRFKRDMRKRYAADPKPSRDETNNPDVSQDGPKCPEHRPTGHTDGKARHHSMNPAIQDTAA